MAIMRDPVVVEEPAVEPVSVEEAGEHLRLDGPEEALWLRRTITAARRHVERFTGRALITQTLEASLDFAPGELWALPRPPLVSVTWIKFSDDGGAETTVAAGNYLVDARSTPGVVALRAGMSWPGVTLGARNGVVVRYVAGYGDEPGKVPAEIRQAILMLVGHFYENREATIVGTIVATTPMGVERLLWPYRVF